MALTPSRSHVAAGATRPSRSRQAGAVWQACVLVCLAGVLIRSPEVLAAATFVGGLAFAVRDYGRAGHHSVSAMTVYAVASALLFGGANLAVFLAHGSRYRSMFYGYGAFEFAAGAQIIATAGALVPLLVYEHLRRVRWSGKGRPFPAVGFPVSPAHVTRFALWLLTIAWAVRIFDIPVGSLGTLSVFLDLGPAIAVFILRMNRPVHPIRFRAQAIDLFPLALVIVDVVYQVLFGFLRVEVLWPVMGFVLPDVLRKRIRRRTVVVLAVALLAFALVFQPLASLRRSSSGLARAQDLVAGVTLDGQAGSVEGFPVLVGTLAVVARLSTVNQLSQVARIAHEDGLQHGRTMEGMQFVFIPRLLWPSKPNIVPGEWFAERLGRGQRTADGFSSAINMTVPGELYLNFGPIGMLLGLVVLAFLYAVVWDAVGHLSEPRNVIAAALGMVLLTQALFVGSNAAAVIQVILVYLATLALGWAYRVVARPQSRVVSATFRT